jgi:hypothetical protein
MKHKPDWSLILWITFIVICAVAIVVCIILRIWVINEYGDMPITEVPSWAIPWITDGR